MMNRIIYLIILLISTIKAGHIDHLPPEIVHKVNDFLKPKDYKVTRQLNRAFRNQPSKEQAFEWLIDLKEEELPNSHLYSVLSKRPGILNGLNYTNRLVFLASSGRLNVIKLLKFDKIVWTEMLIESAFRDQRHVAEYLLTFDFEADLDQFFLAAIYSGSYPIFLMAMNDPRVNPRSNADLALFLACAKGRLEILNFLLLDPHIDPFAGGAFPFFYAIHKNQLHIVRRLLQDPRIPVPILNSRAITLAVSTKSIDMLWLFLNDARFTPRYSETIGGTTIHDFALHETLIYRSLEMFKAILYHPHYENEKIQPELLGVIVTKDLVNYAYHVIDRVDLVGSEEEIVRNVIDRADPLMMEIFIQKNKYFRDNCIRVSIALGRSFVLDALINHSKVPLKHSDLRYAIDTGDKSIINAFASSASVVLNKL
jgi:hypothetical protein